jgi:hypothetical protein
LYQAMGRAARGAAFQAATSAVEPTCLALARRHSRSRIGHCWPKAWRARPLRRANPPAIDLHDRLFRAPRRLWRANLPRGVAAELGGDPERPARHSIQVRKPNPAPAHFMPRYPALPAAARLGQQFPQHGFSEGSERVRRREHVQKHAAIPGARRVALDPHDRELQSPAPGAMRIEEFPAVTTFRVQVPIFARSLQHTPVSRRQTHSNPAARRTDLFQSGTNRFQCRTE